MTTRRQTLIAIGTGLGWPFFARAQNAPSRRAGFLASRSAADSAESLAAFRAGLKEAGFAEGEKCGNNCSYRSQ